MCGLAGILDGRTTTPSLKQRALAMQEKLAHRGPDDRGMILTTNGKGALLHTRLAILDLSDAGHQPMSTPDGRYTLLFNGEIYNFRDLRHELTSAGIAFRSQSDTEVLLRLYQQHGPSCLGMLQGMFAMAVWDAEDNTLFLARDPLGIKPLYIWHHGKSLAFASEIRSLLAADLGPRHVSAPGLHGYLMHGSVQEPYTLLEDIEMLPAGHFATWTLQDAAERPHRSQYWDINWHSDQPAVGSAAEAAELTRYALKQSIDRHFVSDVPVGLFLSGGIDSTAILALAKSEETRQIQTLSIGLEEAEFDESQRASQTARHFGTDHHEWRISATEGRALFAEFLESLDQPSNDGFNTYCVSKFARNQGLKVVLSGLGGDELLGGYPSFRRLPQLVRLGQLARWAGPFRQLAAKILQASGASWKTQRLAQFLTSKGDYSDAYWAMRGFFSYQESSQLVRLYTGSAFPETGSEALNCQVPSQPSDKDVVSYLELTRYMRNQLLRDSDVMSMANSLELRVPLVDRTLVETLRSIPSSLRHAAAKQLMIDAIPEIPSWIANRPKQGFRFPFDRWISTDWGDLFTSIDRWSPVPLGPWYRRWTLFTLHHFLRSNHIDVAATLP